MASRKKSVAIIGVPMDLGTHLRGVDMGPSAIRIAGLGEKLESLGLRVHDMGNIAVPHAHATKPEDQAHPKRKTGDQSLPFAPPIARACKQLMTCVGEAFRRGATPLVLGGDHSIAMGSLGGVARYAKKTRQRIGLLWVDAHGDCNTPETSPSGNIHGMPMAAALGFGVDLLKNLAGIAPMIEPQRSVLLGARDLDPGERENIRKFGIHVLTMRQIDERGVSECMREALDIVAEGCDGFHLSFDIDSLDPSVAPGVGTPVSGGLTIREAHLIMEMVADSQKMISCDLVEVNPTLDQRNMTAHLASELLLSAFGASIL
ncbi:MAG TPA: arginase [Planctomycetota bacterium]|nr:arginase [Planctomycetota bacterium]